MARQRKNHAQCLSSKSKNLPNSKKQTAHNRSCQVQALRLRIQKAIEINYICKLDSSTYNPIDETTPFKGAVAQSKVCAIAISKRNLSIKSMT